MTSINFYKITSANTDKVYIGSTKKDINERLQNHEAQYRLFKDGKYHNVTSFEILECKDYKIELLENKVCQSKEERDTVECKYIINTHNTVNKYLPGRTPEQYNQDNKEYINERQRQYYQNNKEELKQKHKQSLNDPKCISTTFACIKIRYGFLKLPELGESWFDIISLAQADGLVF
jgi:hypothetical protein